MYHKQREQGTCLQSKYIIRGPVVRSLVSLMSSLVLKILTALVSTTSNSQVFFQQKFSIYAIFNDQSFNDMLTNDILSFEQRGPGHIVVPDKALFQTKIADIFLFLHQNMLWVLIRSASQRHF